MMTQSIVETMTMTTTRTMKPEIIQKAIDNHQAAVLRSLLSDGPMKKQHKRLTETRLLYESNRRTFTNGYGRCVSCLGWIDLKIKDNPEIEVGRKGFFHDKRHCKGIGKIRRIRLKSRGKEHRVGRDRSVKRY